MPSTQFVVRSDSLLAGRSIIVTDDETEAWGEVQAILRRGGQAVVHTAADDTCILRYDRPKGTPETCACEHEAKTYVSRSGPRCWCCFGKVAA